MTTRRRRGARAGSRSIVLPLLAGAMLLLLIPSAGGPLPPSPPLGAQAPNGGPLAPRVADHLITPDVRTTAGAIPPAASNPDRPHPGPLGRPTPAFSGHYYAGADYSGSNTSATDLSMEITIPRDDPQSGDFYYVLLSVWDNHQSYDQLGFTNDGGTWGLAYSTTTPCAGNYTFQVDAYTLTPGATYRFDMSIGGGFVSFVVTQLGVGVVFSHTAGTGGTGFVISSSFSCGGGSSLDYTDYEEVYTTTAPVPPYAFRFDNNSLDGSLERSWGAFAGGAPSGVGIGTSGASVTIENVPFDLAVAPSLNSEISPNLHRFSTNLSVLRLNPDGLLQISVSGTIPNATLSVSPPTGAAPFGSSLALNLTSAARPGSYGLEIVVIDGSGIYTRESVSVVVYSALNASAPLFAPTEPEVNQTVGISENPSGGSGGFRYQWSGLPVGCAGAGFSFSCSIPSSGTYPISVNVSDSLGFSSASRTVPLVVVAALRVTLLSNLSTVDVGQSLTFQATTLGGSGGARFAFSGGGTDCLGLGPNYTCVPTSPGTLSVSVTATDSNGHRVSSPPNHVQVSADPSIVVHLGRSTVDAGVPVEMSVTIMGGYGAIRTAWNGLPPSCGALANGSYDCAFPSEGAYSIRVQASDANGFSTESPVLTVQVEPRPTVTLTATPATGLSGNPVALVASVDGGSTPFRFAWSGLPEGCQGSGNATVACTPTAVGSFHVVVSVTDADGANASASVEVTTAVSFLGLPGLEGEIVVGAAVGAVALLAIGVSWRRRARRQRPGPEGSSTDPVGEAGPR